MILKLSKSSTHMWVRFLRGSNILLWMFPISIPSMLLWHKKLSLRVHSLENHHHLHFSIHTSFSYNYAVLCPRCYLEAFEAWPKSRSFLCCWVERRKCSLCEVWVRPLYCAERGPQTAHYYNCKVFLWCLKWMCLFF